MSQFHLETEIIRSQIERSQHQEHSSPLYLTSSYVFEDAEEMRASFLKKKNGISTADSAIRIHQNLSIASLKWKEPKLVTHLLRE